MEYANLGRSGLQVSRLCLGCMTFGSKQWRPWVIGEDEARAIIKRALELGINFFDTANMYSLGLSEEILGRAIKDFVADRDDVVIATKVYYPMKEGVPNQRGLSRKHIEAQIDASLKRLQTDYVDLYQIHRWDYWTPIEETMETLNDLVRAGKVRYLGASSMYAWQFAKAVYTADQRGWTRPVSMQSHYNLLYREEEREMLPFCRQEGMGIIPWGPLARGLLARPRPEKGGGETLRSRTDDYTRQLYDQANPEIIDRVVEVAERRGVTPAQIALAWLLHQPGITAPIIGVRTIEHLEEAVGALDIALSEEERTYLEEPYRPQPVRGHE
ncbi:MAG: aldo/keto reductase [Acidobacteria bacterium]|nr:MAG: aldo/keto reductase [Acidobacteriota bacterium]